MSLFQRLLNLVFPTLAIRPRYRDIWEQRERQQFFPLALWISGLAGIGHILHLLFVDPNLDLNPKSLWIWYRISMALLCATVFAITAFSNKVRSSRYFRWPYFLMIFVVCYFQARTLAWSPLVPYAFAIVIPTIGAIGLRKSSFVSSVILGVMYISHISSWHSRPGEFVYIVSAAFVGLIFVALIRGRYAADVSAFISEQERLEAQSALIAVQQDLNSQIRAFLPREIYRRFERLVSREKKSSLQAMDEVLRLKVQQVTCLYSDIRGYTKRSKDSLNYVRDVAIPNIRVCTETIDAYEGIPRLVGDLVFGYFDGDNIEAFLRGLACGIKIYFTNMEMNQKVAIEEQKIQRFIIVSYGEALVGNIGGTENAREISVMGSPANILSRIDSLTKTEQFKSKVPEGSVILSSLAAQMLSQIQSGIKLHQLDLEALGLTLRDYPLEKQLSYFEVSEANERLLSQKLSQVRSASGKSDWNYDESGFEGDAA